MPSPQLGWSHCVKLWALTNHSQIRGLSEQLHTHTLTRTHTYPHNNANYFTILTPSNPTPPISSSIAVSVMLSIHLSSFLGLPNCSPSVSQHQHLPFASVFLYLWLLCSPFVYFPLFGRSGFTVAHFPLVNSVRWQKSWGEDIMWQRSRGQI